MGAEVIVFANRKGGTAKSTSLLSVGSGLHRKGLRVLYIDTDSQGSLTFNLGVDPEEVTASTAEVLTGSVTAEEAILETEEGSLIPASPRLYKVKFVEKDRIRRAIKPILDRFDFVLIDTAPARDLTLIAALTASDSVIIPCEARKGSLDGLRLLYGTIQTVKKTSNPNLTTKGIVITRCRPRTLLVRDMRENLQEAADALDTRLFQTEIRDSIKIAEAEALQQSIFKHAPRSKVAADYSALIEEILERRQ